MMEFGGGAMMLLARTFSSEVELSLFLLELSGSEVERWCFLLKLSCSEVKTSSSQGESWSWEVK